MLGGSRICRTLPANNSGSAGKNRNRPTRPRFYSSATCGFVSKNRVVLGGFRFFLALPENAALHRELKRKSQHPRQHPVVADTSKGRCRKTEQRPFFVIASRRVHDDCITEDILSERPVTLARTDEIDKKEVRRINPFRENQIDL